MSEVAAGPPAAQPGSLEWLADAEGDAPVLIDAGGATLTRRQYDRRADALGRGLAAEHAVHAGARVALRLPAGPDLLVALYALAKLGASPVLLDPTGRGPSASPLAHAAGCPLLVSDGILAGRAGGPTVLPRSALPGLIGRHGHGDRLLSGAQVPADGVQGTDPRTGAVRLVLRARSPERIARLAATVGDLLARVALAPGGVHLLGPGADRPEPQFWASVALVTGGRVVTQPAADPERLLASLAEHQVTSAVLDTATVRTLLALPATVTETADLTAFQRLVSVGPPPDAALVAAAADLFGEDVLHHVHASTQTGPFAHADSRSLEADPRAATALAGVQIEVGADGELLVRSPLAADGALGPPALRGGWPAPPGWRDTPVPSGWTGTADAAGRMSVRAARP